MKDEYSKRDVIGYVGGSLKLQYYEKKGVLKFPVTHKELHDKVLPLLGWVPAFTLDGQSAITKKIV